MPVHLLASAVSSAVPTEYWASIAASLVAISFLKTWSQGVKLLDPPPPPTSSSTNSAPISPSLDAHLNDLHGRVVLVASGAFTPLGVVTISALAHRGAQIIALAPDISSPDVVQLVHLIRDSTQSELVYAEQCDIASLESVSAFAALWNAGDKKQQQGIRRLDSLIFLPPSREEVRTLQATGVGMAQAIYQLHVLARFHLVNSLLSSLLVLPPEREVRIVSVVSPFYAAGANHFDLLTTGTATKPKGKRKATPTIKTLAEGSYSALVGAASLRWYALSIELQRRLDLLAEADPRPRTKLPGIDVSSARPTASTPHTHSNIAVINVCPGFERNADIIDTFLPPPSPSSFPPLYFARAALRMVLVLVVWPVVWLLAKSAATAANSVVWATARKLDGQARTHPILNNASPAHARFGLYEPLVPAELYREARIVRPTLPARLDPNSKDARHNWAQLWQHEEHLLEHKVKAKGGKIKRPQV
ncbi:oxidoreductase [Moesziomyces antarcticus]|uniref:Uncharacterized protein n=2 Tax=Pseudozyma antarctica TaxID=84753 RepID=A0A5C3FN53_PSEA2|nr:oxidoreductase [Moesziomyces antarcticus]GAK64847.1 oxidoreductase [Moesziomyces antarcticus]SPO45842.1 uncharacterized protein PSANT_03528 [Moesziomyces antarcticus]